MDTSRVRRHVFYLTLLKDAFWRWYQDNTFRLGAALAYYTVFSLAPIVLIAVAVAGVVFGRQQAQQRVIDEVNTAAGEQVASAVSAMLQFTQQGGVGLGSTLFSVGILVFAATAVFAQLQDALNTIWGVKARANQGWTGMVKDRLWSFTIVLVIGFLLLVSLVMSAALRAASQYAASWNLPGGTYLWQTVDWLVSFALVTGLFAAIYKFLPDVEIEWRDVWVGAAMTAALFALGKYLIGTYLAQSSWISAYNAAGSLVVILLWVYYSSQIFLYGAELTYVYADRTGKALKTKAHAEPVTEEARAREGMERQPTAGTLEQAGAKRK